MFTAARFRDILPGWGTVRVNCEHRLSFSLLCVKRVSCCKTRDGTSAFPKKTAGVSNGNYKEQVVTPRNVGHMVRKTTCDVQTRFARNSIWTS